jgi:hypothetical protein
LWVKNVLHVQRWVCDLYHCGGKMGALSYCTYTTGDGKCRV